MTLVDAETGEVVALLTEEQARRLVARINGAAAELAELVQRDREHERLRELPRGKHS